MTSGRDRAQFAQVVLLLEFYREFRNISKWSATAIAPYLHGQSTHKPPPPILTECFPRFHQDHGKRQSDRQLLERPRHLKMPRADHRLAVDRLYMIADDAILAFRHHTVLLDPLDESVSRAVVGDGQAKRGLYLLHLDLLDVAFDVCVDEVFETDLAAQQTGHVDFVDVECAKEDLVAQILSMTK